MKFISASPEVLLKPLQTVMGIVERRGTMPILSNILLKKEGTQVSIVATDLDIQITTKAEFGIGDDVETTTVPARKLSDILRALPSSNNVNINYDKDDKGAGKVQVASGKSRFNLQTLPAVDFPKIKAEEEWVLDITVSQKTLRNQFNLVHYAMASNDIRYYLNGLLLECEGGMLRSITTDAHRLALAATAVPGLDKELSAIVPRKTISEMLRLLDDSEEPVQIQINSRQIQFSFGDVQLLSKLIDGKYPDYKKVVPEVYKDQFEVDRETLKGSLQRVNVLATEKAKTVKFILADNQLNLATTNEDNESADDVVEVQYSGERLEMGFNIAYLLEGINVLKNNNVTLSVNPQGASSLLVTSSSDEHFKYLVMPMRI